MNTETQDAASSDGWSSWARGDGPGGGARAPRLVLLYHSDLDRLGARSVPFAIPPAGRWLTLGRNEPLFAAAGAEAEARPITDPQVSREQLRLRFLPDQGRFEVEPAERGRRPVGLVDLRGGAPGGAATPITRAVLLEPGACIAVGDRVLLGLTLGRARDGDEEARLGLVGESEALWALRDEIRSVAQFGRPALILGPTGAGKELVALALHRASARAAGPFVAVNCAALPEALVESTLFGHRKGAFTGADADAKGLFRAAEGGTLFLDELGELPIATQPKLLRALQEGVVVPVGTHEGKRVDVRVLGATHRDLEALVRAGKLREDLYHRMAAHLVRVPSLAERRFDIPELFVHMLRRLREEHPSLGWLWARGQAFQPALPIGFMAALLRRPWSGNVRELQNLVEQTARLNLHEGSFRAPDAPPTDALAEGARDAVDAGAAALEGAPGAAEGSDTGEAGAGAKVPEALVRAAGEALGLAHKTVLKLLAPSALAALAEAFAREGLEPAAREARLWAAAKGALVSLLEADDYNQSAVAAALGTSRTTLIKLMDDLGLPRAADLGAEEIARARAQAGGDLDAAARLLHVSPSALKKRLTLLNLKAQR